MSFLPQNNQNKVACVLVLDGSSSMNINIDMKKSFSRIDALNLGVIAFKDDLLRDSVAKKSVDIAIIKVSDVKPELILDWVSAEQFSPPKIVASGSTPLASALINAVEMCEKRKRYYLREGLDYYRPWVIIISDGEPTDSDSDWNSAVNIMQSAINSKKIFSIGVAIDKCSTKKIQQVSSNKVVELSSHQFSEFFVWLSGSINATLNSTDGTEQFIATNLIS